MTSIVRTVDLFATPDDVWALLGDFGNISAWAPNVDHSSLASEQAVGVGAVRRIQSGSATLLERVIAWEPPTTLSYEFEGLPPVVRGATNTWHVYLVGDRTRVTLTTQVEAGPRPPHKLVARVVGRMMGKASDQMLAGLRSALT